MRRMLTTLLGASLLLAALTPSTLAQDQSAEPSTDVEVEEPWPSARLWGARDITAAHDQFVAVGHGGKGDPFAKSWVSPDGLDWTRAPDSAALQGASMGHVLGVDGGYVAMGADKKDRLAAWYSPDGLSWDRADVEKPGRKGLETGIRGVVDGPGGLLALGVFVGQDYAGHRLWRSTDGMSWVVADGPEIELVDTVVGMPDGYWLLGHEDGGSTNSFWRSTDGLSWARMEGLPWLRDAAVGDDGTVAGVGITDIWATRDQEAWERVWGGPPADGEEGDLHWIEWDGAQFVTTGNVGYEYLPCLYDGVGWCPQEPLLTSPDGFTWTESVGPDGVPGPDRETAILGTASLGDTTVALGFEYGEPEVAWLMNGTQD